MMLYMRYADDGTLAGVHLNGDDFAQDVTISKHLLAQADARFIQRDGETVTIACDEGVATYRVTSEGNEPVVGEPTPGWMHATLVSIVRPEEMVVSA